MKGQRKRSKYVDEQTRRVVADNVRWRMADEFKTESDMPEALAKKAGTYKSRIQAVLTGSQGTSIDMLAQLAKALRCEPYQLLIPPEHQHRFAYPLPAGGRRLEADVDRVHDASKDNAVKYSPGTPSKRKR